MDAADGQKCSAGEKFPPPFLPASCCSHAFIPFDIHDHTGVYYPSGAILVNGEGNEQSLVVAYGKGDDRILTMELSHSMVTEYLEPVEGRDPRNYKFCTMPISSL